MLYGLKTHPDEWPTQTEADEDARIDAILPSIGEPLDDASFREGCILSGVDATALDNPEPPIF